MNEIGLTLFCLLQARKKNGLLAMTPTGKLAGHGENVDLNDSAIETTAASS
jgi:hypothetical protein